MTLSKEKAKGSKPVYKMKIEKDVYIPMRDGIKIAADIYRPDADGKFPALLAFSPFSKELQSTVLTFPPQNRPNPLWDGCIDTDDTNWMAKLLDVDPAGKAQKITTGWLRLKASHREIDEERTKPYQPYHPHTRSVPVTPGEIYE